MAVPTTWRLTPASAIRLPAMGCPTPTRTAGRPAPPHPQVAAQVPGPVTADPEKSGSRCNGYHFNLRRGRRNADHAPVDHIRPRRAITAAVTTAVSAHVPPSCGHDHTSGQTDRTQACCCDQDTATGRGVGRHGASSGSWDCSETPQAARQPTGQTQLYSALQKKGGRSCSP
jgi:hypothetical protein